MPHAERDRGDRASACDEVACVNAQKQQDSLPCFYGSAAVLFKEIGSLGQSGQLLGSKWSALWARPSTATPWKPQRGEAEPVLPGRVGLRRTSGEIFG